LAVLSTRAASHQREHDDVVERGHGGGADERDARPVDLAGAQVRRGGGVGEVEEDVGEPDVQRRRRRQPAQQRQAEAVEHVLGQACAAGARRGFKRGTSAAAGGAQTCGGRAAQVAGQRR